MRILGLALGAALLVTACGDNDVNHCDDAGYACNWAGLPGEFGFNGDGHDRRDTQLYWTMDLVFASDHTVWFIDWNNHLVRRVLQDDTVTSVVGWTDPIFPGDGVSGSAERMPDGVMGTEVKLNHPTDLMEAPDGGILFMAWHNHKIRRIDPATGHVRIVAGGGAGFAGDGGPVSAAVFKQPKAMQMDPAGNLYILDQQNFRIRKIDAATQVISTIAGSGMQGYDGDNGPALSAKLNFEAGSNPEPSGGLAMAGNTLYISDTLSNRVRAVDLNTNMITTVVGTGDPAVLNHPRDLEIGPEGDLYIADTDNSRILAVNLTTGATRTVAGTGELGLDPDDDHLATETKLARPFSIDFDPAGNLYISDTLNSRILKVNR